MEKINIMFLYSSKGFGGIVRNLSLIVNNLNRELFNIVVVALTNENDTESSISLVSNKSVIFYRIDDYKKLDFNIIRRLKELAISHKIDILSCHGYKADIYGAVISGFYKRNFKLFAMIHGWIAPEPKFYLYNMLDRIVLRRFDKIIYVSKNLLKQVPIFKNCPDKVVVIENAIDINEFKKGPKPDSVRAELGLGKEDVVVGFVGRLSKEKGAKTVLDALGTAPAASENIKLILAGDGPQRKELERRARDLGVSKKVIFLGHRKDIKNIYNAMDVYVSASLREGFPNSVLEAQSAGVPCIVTDIGGNNDIIQDGINGLLVKPGDYRDMSKKLSLLIKDKKLREKFIEEGERMAISRFSLKDRIRKLEELYTMTVRERS